MSGTPGTPRGIDFPRGATLPLEICTDCLFALAYGPSSPQATNAAVHALRLWAELGYDVTGDCEYHEDHCSDHGTSREPCGLCRSPMWGYRFAATVVPMGR